MRQKRETIERKMAQAEEKRQHMLKSKAQKAHDEEAKVGGGMLVFVMYLCSQYLNINVYFQ